MRKINIPYIFFRQSFFPTKYDNLVFISSCILYSMICLIRVYFCALSYAQKFNPINHYLIICAKLTYHIYFFDNLFSHKIICYTVIPGIIIKRWLIIKHQMLQITFGQMNECSNAKTFNYHYYID